jgi:hypothetical protein
MYIDSNANLYVAELVNSCVRVIHLSTGIVDLVVGGSTGNFVSGVPALSSVMQNIYAISINTVGDIYVADSAQYIVAVVSHSDGNI